MTDEAQYPYELENSFFINLVFKRAAEVPHPIEIPTATEINIAEPGFPNLQIGVKVKSQDELPITFDVHLIGMFKYLGEQKEYDHDLNIEYTFQRGIYLLWPSIVQFVKVVTMQMGMSPLQVRTPINFRPKNPA